MQKKTKGVDLACRIQNKMDLWMYEDVLQNSLLPYFAFMLQVLPK